MAENSNNVVTKEYRYDNAMSWLTHGVDFESRRIHLDGDVNEYMSSIVIRALVKMTEISNAPIEVYLSSYGGDAYAGLAIYDAIRACPCDIIMYANGKIMSSGLIIFLAGDRRFAAEHTTFMAHAVSSSTDGKVKDQEIDVNEAKRINNIMLEVLQIRSKRNKKYWYRKIMHSDFYFSVNEAKEMGVVTVGVQKKEKVQNEPVKKGNKTRPTKTKVKVSNTRVSRRRR